MEKAVKLRSDATYFGQILGLLVVNSMALASYLNFSFRFCFLFRQQIRNHKNTFSALFWRSVALQAGSFHIAHIPITLEGGRMPGACSPSLSTFVMSLLSFKRVLIPGRPCSWLLHLYPLVAFLRGRRGHTRLATNFGHGSWNLFMSHLASSFILWSPSLPFSDMALPLYSIIFQHVP